MRTILATLILAALAACDTLHGVTEKLSPAAVVAGQPCVSVGLDSVRLQAVQVGKGQYEIRHLEGTGPEFFLSQEKDSPVFTFYLQALNQELPCSSLKEVVPLMRAAARAVSQACSSLQQQVVVSEKWQSQASCGL